jgi:hypothetical protein
MPQLRVVEAILLEGGAFRRTLLSSEEVGRSTSADAELREHLVGQSEG